MFALFAIIISSTNMFTLSDNIWKDTLILWAFSFVILYTVRAETLCCLLSCQLPFEMQLTPFLLAVNTMAPFCPKPVVLLV